MEQRVREKSLSSVRFLGALPKREVVEHLLRADLCLICTWDHPFHRMVLANKIFDYLASARPVVAAAEGEMADLLSESGAGLSVSPGDGPGMAEAIERLRSLPAEERRAMGRRGRAYALAHFRRRDLADRVEAALDEVLEEERE
jgi:glycosyltransferase involved in cell wall biosynthesis